MNGVARRWSHFGALAPSFVYGWSVVLVAAVTALLWLVRLHISTANVTLAYLIVVFVCASTAGREPALLSALLSFLAFKILFVPPIWSLDINNLSDLWEFGCFVIAALSVGAITIQAREQAAAAERQRREMTVLYDVSQTISADFDIALIAPVIVRSTAGLLGCVGCGLLLSEGDAPPAEVARAGDLAAGVRIDLPLRCRGQVLGALRVALPPGQAGLSPAQERLCTTIAHQAALAVERSRLAQMAARAQALAEADRLKSALLSAVSHDLRTPLAAIIAATDELLADDVRWTQAASRDFAQIIQREASHLHDLVTNMLDLTRLEAGALQPRRGWYNLAEIVHRALARLAPLLEGRPLELDLPEDLPLIPVDYVQIEQVLWNVLHNALTYAPAGSPICVSVAQSADALLVTVGDRGPGVPAAERTRVFEKFYRLTQSEQAKIPGAGLGLAICKGLVEAHGGQIALGGRSGGGALVTIRLPLTLAEQGGSL